MRKCYVIIGSTTDNQGYYTWITCVKSSWKKAVKARDLLKANRPGNEYTIQVEIID